MVPMLLALSLSTFAAEKKLEVGVSIQPRYAVTLNGDPDASDADAISDAGFRIRRALLLVSGSLAGHFEYRFRVDAAKALTFTDGADKSQLAQKPILDDAQIVTRIADPLQIAVGQWKVPFTASRMSSDTTLLFIDRPIVLDGAKFGDAKWSGYDWSREAGVAVLGSVADKRLEYQVGAFNGDGANVWPGDEAPLWVARVAAAPLGEFAYDEVDLAHGAPRLGIGAAVTLENTPTYDETGAAGDAVRDLRAGGELRFAAAGLSVNAEAVTGLLSSGEAEPVHSLGVYAQVGYCLPFGVAPGLRWARLDPSLDAEDDGLTTVEGVLNVFAPDPDKQGANLGHKAKLQIGWTTALQDGLDHPLYHQGQVAAVLGI